VFRVKDGEMPVRGTDAPELRIVAEKLWNAVVERRETVKRVYQSTSRPGLLRAMNSASRYLLSGLLKCSQCGANLQIISGRGRNRATQNYGCPMNFHRGDSVCSNRVRIRRDVLERELLAGIQQKVLREDVIEYTLARFEETLSRELRTIGGDMDRMRKRKADLESEIERLAAGLASGIYSVSVMAEIARREREVREIGDRLLSSEPDSVRIRIEKLRENVLAQMHEVREYLSADPQTARTWLTKHVDRIVMEPNGGIYIASGNWNLLGLRQSECAEGQN
jgi:site-specific DNA recombinase